MLETARPALQRGITAVLLGGLLASGGLLSLACESQPGRDLSANDRGLVPAPGFVQSEEDSTERPDPAPEPENEELPWMQRSWRESEQAHGHDLAVGDINRDGFPDVFVGIWEGRDLLYLGGSDGFKRAWQSGEELESHGVAIGDVDGDGHLDLAVGVKRGASAVYLGRSGFSEVIRLAPDSLTKSLAIGDVDGDGDGDLVLGNQGANELFLFEDGAFVLAWTSEESEESDSVRFEDFDGDGDLDLAVGNSTEAGQPNRVYRNGRRGLKLAWTSPDSLRSNQVAWGDLDGDGILELAVANAGAPAQVWSRKKKGWERAWESEGAPDGVGVAWGDIDGDGDSDLLVANPSDTQVFENQGGRLRLQGRFGHGGGTEALGLLDARGDGRLGVALARNGSILELWQQVR